MENTKRRKGERMSYTICDQYGNPKPLRLLLTNASDGVRVGKEFTPYWWSCDPCASSAERYQIEYHADQAKPTGHAWYQVVTSDDTQGDIDLKIEHYVKVIAAKKAKDAADLEYRRLNGGL